MLTFDAWQRTETVRTILNFCLPESIAEILDVGGYPGRMKQLLPKHKWVICDPLVDAAGDQVQGSAYALPFRDASFDLSISLDVLEHIPPEHRLSSLDEMARVSRAGMVLTFPYEHPTVLAAENKIREMHQSLFQKDHPWLSEHQAYPLPDVDELVSHLEEKGGQVMVLDVGSLRQWVYLQMTDLVLESLPGGLDLANAVDSFYKEKLLPGDYNQPAYRKVVFHLFHLDEPIPLALPPTPQEDEIPLIMEMEDMIYSGILKLFTAQKKEADTLSEQSEQSVQASEYLSRLEKTQQIWEATYTDTIKELKESYEWRDRLENRFSFKVYRRLMRILGRPVKN